MSLLFVINLVSYLLAAFFAFGGILNIRPPEQMRRDYARWGYPTWFHYVTAILELTTAVLIVLIETRLIGALLGATIMFAAAATTLWYREYKHSFAPLIGLLLMVFLCVEVG